VITCFTATISTKAPLVSRRVQEYCSILQASLLLTIFAEVMLSHDAGGEDKLEQTRSSCLGLPLA